MSLEWLTTPELVSALPIHPPPLPDEQRLIGEMTKR